MPIPVLPIIDLSSPTFSDDIDAFFGPQISNWGTEVEACVAALTLDDFIGTSASSVAIGLGAKTFTASTSKQFAAGMYVVVADAAAPSTNSMTGQVTSYDSVTGALAIESLFVHGSGTKTSWIITLSGDPATTGVATVSGDISVTNVTSSGAITSSSPTDGIGYDTGAGGTVQLTSSPRARLDKTCGTVTMISGTLPTFTNEFNQIYMYLDNAEIVSLRDIVEVTMVGTNAGYFTLVPYILSVGTIGFVLTNKTNATRSYTGLKINFSIIRNVAA